MQHQSDDMDELFRKAAEGYPLNTGSADWEKVHALLSAKEEPVRESVSKRRYLWLLALLPVLLICKPVSDALLSAPGYALAKQQSNPTMADKQPASATATTKPAFFTEANRSTAGKPKDITLRSAVPNETSLKTPIVTVKNSSGGLREETVLTASNHSTNPVVTVVPIRLVKSLTQSEAVVSDLPAPVIVSGRPAAINNEKIDSAAFAAKTIATDKATAGQPKKRRFFISLVAGPDLSTVKFQTFSEIGYQAGVLLGFRFSKRFSIEAGALSSRKYYYSEGSYVNTDKVYVPANAELVAVDGNCRMVELPLSLRYTFSGKKKHSWFASAGLVSYLMSSEDYSYDYYYPSTGYVYTHRSNYRNESKNWFSVLQLTAGYMSKLGNFGHLRVEPYYSLPIKGVGYGELPISSIGIRLGLTSKHF